MPLKSLPLAGLPTANDSDANDHSLLLHTERHRNQLDLLVDSATDYAICMLDRQGLVVIWNKGAERIFGWPEAEVLGRHYSVLFPDGETSGGKPNSHLQQALEQGKLQYRGWRLRQDGTEFLASVTLTSIRDSLGSEIGFGKVVRDITSEQAHADAIEAREVHLQSILATVPDAMVVINESGMMISFSAAAQRLFGYTQEEALENNVNLLMGTAWQEVPGQFLMRYGKSVGRRVPADDRRVMGRRKDGSLVPVELTIDEATGGGKRVFTAFLRDLTEREEAQARVQQVQDELLHLSRVSAMGTMAAMLAHEINQPLTAVTNYVQTSRILLDAADEHSIASVRGALAVAEGEVVRAGEIVRRLREFIARGETRKSNEPLAQLIADSCLLALAGVRERGILSRVDVPSDVQQVFIDRVQIQQVLINLIRNAVEAMAPDGSGEIAISTQDEGEFVRITVADTGPGLPAEISGRLFQAFTSTKSEGMGLGLSICRTIIEGHGGQIWHEQRPGGGTAFHFTVIHAPGDAGAS